MASPKKRLKNLPKRKELLDPELLKSIFYCPILKEHVEVEKSLMSFYGDSHPCELCGSHGEVTVSFVCECGDRHRVTLYDY